MVGTWSLSTIPVIVLNPHYYLDNPASGGFGLLVGGVMTAYALADTLCRRTRTSTINEMVAGDKTHTIEGVTSVKIEDLQGLDALLERTKKAESKEWGTVIRQDIAGTRLVVKEILDSTEARPKGFVVSEGSQSIIFNPDRIAQEGFNGIIIIILDLEDITFQYMSLTGFHPLVFLVS